MVANSKELNDGKEPFKKVGFALKVAAFSTMIFAPLDVGRRYFHQNPYASVVRIGQRFLLWSAITTTFTATVVLLTNIRKKEDPWNYFYAAHASTAVIYSFTRLGPVHSFSLAITSSIIAAMAKYFQMENITLFDTTWKRGGRYDFYVSLENSPDVRDTK